MIRLLQNVKAWMRKRSNQESIRSLIIYREREREREIFDDDGMCFPFVSNKRRREEEMCLIHFIIHASSFVSTRRNHFYCWDLPVVYNTAVHSPPLFWTLFQHLHTTFQKPYPYNPSTNTLPIQISCITITTNIANTNFQLLYNNYAI